MMDFYEKVKTILYMDHPASIMHITTKIPRLCNYFESESVFEHPLSGSPSNRPCHEIFPESGVPLILGMVIFPREGSMNTCSVMETQGIEHDRDQVDFYNEAEA